MPVALSSSPAGAAPTTIALQNNDDALKAAATELEASFLSEMLKSAGFGKARESFGGGAGEDQFSSMLVRAQADEMAKSGGIGLAEALYNSLKEAQE